MVNIKDIKDFKDLNLRQTFRAHIIYEQIMEHSFTPDDGLNGIIVLLYSYICGSNHDTIIDYNDYMDWLDDNPDMVVEFTTWYTNVLNMVNGKDTPEEGDESKKA